MSMLVDIALVNKGLVRDCDYVLSASDAYRQSQDVISEFTNEIVVKCDGNTVKKTRLNDLFKTWFSNTYGTKCPQLKELHVYMDKKFGKSNKNGWNNVIIVDDLSNEDDNNTINDPDEPNI